MRSRKLRKFLRELYGEQRIEELWVPFFAVATNLTTARRRVFSQRRIRDAVRASISIPGGFVPVVERGHVLVDGGVIDNFPVEQMQHEAQTRSIIAVNVAPPRVRRRYDDLHGEVSGWRLLLNRLNPFSRNLRFPSVIATLLRALEISSVRTVPAQQDRAFLLVEPDVKSIAILDFRRFKTATDLGYESARERLNRWAAEELAFLDLPLDPSSSKQVEAPTEADRR